MSHINEPNLTVLWSTPNGIRCVVRPYDEERFQLKLIRDQGTIKSDLCAGYLDAVETARLAATTQ